MTSSDLSASEVGASHSQPSTPEVSTVLRDTFPVDQAPGTVIGSTGPSGARRTGVDVEGRIGADNGALRIKPLEKPGWGREGIAYGPFEHQAGLVLGVHVLNGHHASQTFYQKETWRIRLRRVLGDIARLRWRPRERHHESLAVGFFDSEAPPDPLAHGHALVVHSATQDNGELWAADGGTALRAVRGFMNVPTAAFVVLRDEGAAYYAATVENDADFPSLPHVRPLGITRAALGRQVFPGVHQRILGEVGYRVDSRVYQVEVAQVPSLASWFGTADRADRLAGDGPLAGSAAEHGQGWHALSGAARRSPAGLAAAAEGCWAVLAGEQAAGLLHVVVEAGSAPQPVGVSWRGEGDGSSSWRVLVGPAGARLEVAGGDGFDLVATDTDHRIRRRRKHALQVLDDGRTFSVHLDGRLLFDRWFGDDRLADGTACGVVVPPGAGTAILRDFEVHPRTIAAPIAAEPAWPAIPDGTVTVVDERFDITAEDLDGLVTPSGGRQWSRVVGPGRFAVLDGRACVVADVDKPNPDRTIYAIAWDDPRYVDVAVTSTPPGTARGQGHNGRGGLVLWQDEQNYIVVNIWLDDWFPGVSVSTFYRINGHEDMYDAVWTLVGESVTWGAEHTLRVAFDGVRLMAYVDGRPVLYRAVTDVYADAPRLDIRGVGLIANEEWGNDTGTVFSRVVVRGRERQGDLQP